MGKTNYLNKKTTALIDERGNLVDETNPSYTSHLFGVPNSFTKETSNQVKFNVAKGQVNNFRLRPQILNEHAESSREIQSTVTATNKVCQIFKASQDNINEGYLTVSSAEAVFIDGFETYDNDSELQAVWVASNRLAALETSIVKTGEKSMALPTTTGGDEWIRTSTVIDYTNFTGSFDAYFTDSYSNLKVAVFIGDGTNTKSTTLVFNTANNWVHFDILESNMEEDGAGTTNVTAITQIGFRIVDRDYGSYCYIDNLSAAPEPGTLGLELWDLGATLPVDGVTSLDDGTQYEQLGDISSVSPVSQVEIPLLGGKRLYHLHNFVAGVAHEIPDNKLLNVNNYYALVLTYTDTNVIVYGPNSSYEVDYYENGFAFTAPDNSTPITKIGTYNDLMFSIFSTQDVYLTKSVAIANATPGSDANFMSSVEDENMKTSDIVITHGVYAAIAGEVLFDNRPIYLPKGGKFNLDYNDDYSDGVETIVFGARYVFEPPNTNG